MYNHTIGQGTNLVLLHGWGMNSAVWADIATLLAQNFRVTLIDLPGHGLSPWDHNKFTNIQSWAEGCLQIAPPHAIWIGWSLGGTISLKAALLKPRYIKKLVLVTATPSFLSNATWPFGLATNTLERFLHNLNTNWAETLGNFLTLQVSGSKMARPVLRTLRQRLAKSPSPNLQALNIGLQILQHTNLAQQISALKIPNLWLYGERDTLVPKQGAITLAHLLPTAQIHIIQDAAHAPFISHPEQALQLLQQFIVKR
ncbi:hypothetical protein TI05_01020 [Achromatium sp. WMS3]|nr:hypothetical protein TI05_01020 [Achromatium sp. WMS3]